MWLLDIRGDGYMGISNNDEIFKVEDVARYLKVGKNRVYDLIHNGKIKVVRIGRSIRVPKWCVLEYVTNQEGIWYNDTENRLPDERRNCA